MQKLSKYFEGYYYKHQNKKDTLCIIVGHSETEKFIQVITQDDVWQVPYEKGNIFSKKGIRLQIKTPNLTMRGTIRYRELSPIRYDIMGPFRFFPMECRHGVISMRHRLEGKIQLNGKIFDFTDGIGYIEKDSGRSFPSDYTWVQANDFQEACSIMAAVAVIPFCGLKFLGCICVIQYQGKEYRIATYLGGKAVVCTKNKMVLRQGKYTLDIEINSQNGQRLNAPQNGEMRRTILETASCPAEFRFYKRKELLFHLHSEKTSFEYENMSLNLTR